MLFQDTIAAISTPIGVGGIGIIRVSGRDSVTIVDKVFRAANKKLLIDTHTHTINYGHIINDNGEILDEVLVMLMKGPRTFTREDVVEINCHGGPVPLNTVLMELIKNGARLAENGEFTKRAFLNGRIDLAQVEAIMDIIEAKTELSLSQAVGQLEGRLSKKIREYQERLIQVIARIEVSIDYPEYDQDEPITDDFEMELRDLVQEFNELLATADTGKMIREGVKTAIVGRPNVGKSSLLNALLEENKAIVTDIPGTTRDIVEAYLNIDGIPFLLLDTAGIRETEDVVEKIGVEKSKSSIEAADIVLMLIDSHSGITDKDIEILEQVRGKKIIYVCTKNDLGNTISREIVEEYLRYGEVINISSKTQYGLVELKNSMKQFVIKGSTSINGEVTLSNNRQKEALVKAIKSLNKVIEAIEIGLPEDCLAIDLHDAYGHLGMIIGEALKDEIINQLFSRFCLGK
ncbi:tRNA uridine-5-carboxymethylaminomethyl(34) synthesis GTPase MnmE [Sporanaerobium hydrogeniformans]|uniref:tRNA uridine-5-carboxymethylaminomethyl(34) synthesis GTPase MnmE n=1 Tax=Sporanaerobium hydrogeniformans TaxID=3072179 RepID=A0AC61DCW7_9FIRM|nr:tRNA uridine-5-carboxymethylaminomethyl(34) synthesis GTPase MnmE [Sporanaerobium hydrogeniformans]PHV70618.1 tRNA uridine-5-carboxymethylaminomethyl(34) synthesis GTPase MnmE [Sporanaerobium hydrogeniformans]